MVPLSRLRLAWPLIAACIFLIILVSVASMGVIAHRGMTPVDDLPVERAKEPARDAATLLRKLRRTAVSTATHTSTPPRSSFWPPGATPVETVHNVESAPDRDSPEAQLAVAKAYQECAGKNLTDAEIEDIAARRSLKLANISEFEGPAGDARLLAYVTSQATDMKKTRDLCMALPPAEIAQWPQILEKLAIAGDRRARDVYVSSFWQGPSGDQWLDQVSTSDYERAQDLARQFLWERIEQGDCDNMLLNNLWRAPVGPVSNYIGWHVLNGQAPSAPADDRERAFVQTENERLNRELPPDQLNEADQIVSYLLETCPR